MKNFNGGTLNLVKHLAQNLGLKQGARQAADEAGFFLGKTMPRWRHAEKECTTVIFNSNLGHGLVTTLF